MGRPSHDRRPAGRQVVQGPPHHQPLLFLPADEPLTHQVIQGIPGHLRRDVPLSMDDPHEVGLHQAAILGLSDERGDDEVCGALPPHTIEWHVPAH